MINRIEDKKIEIKDLSTKDNPKYLSEVMIIKGFWRGYKGVIVDFQYPKVSLFSFFNSSSNQTQYLVKFKIPNKMFKRKVWFMESEIEVIK